jgi:hypothetical protein
MEDHIVKNDDNEYEITFHPAFASRCTVSKGGRERELFKQQGVHKLEGKALPKKHVIRLKSKKGGKRDITITLDDALHSVARITVELYDESHDPTARTLTAAKSDTVFTVENHAKVCPPYCDPVGET